MSLHDSLNEIIPFVNKNGTFSMNIYGKHRKKQENILASVLKFNSVFVLTIDGKSEILPTFIDVITSVQNVQACYIRVYGLISVLLTNWEQGHHSSYTFKATKDLVL